ncbi:hypothetical protein AA0118_g5378 [Alternaria tenuissima]|nr:hypothetical protein AA0118_g5378 [Alternaria tenuissima]
MNFTQSSDTSGRLNYAGSGTDLKRARRGNGPKFINKPIALRESGNIARTNAERGTDTSGGLCNTLDFKGTRLQITAPFRPKHGAAQYGHGYQKPSRRINTKPLTGTAGVRDPKEVRQPRSLPDQPSRVYRAIIQDTDHRTTPSLPSQILHFQDDQAKPAKIDHAAEKEPTIKESGSVPKKRAFEEKEARSERNAKKRVFREDEEQVMNEARTAKEKTNIRVTRSVTKRRTATTEQMKLGGNVMFTVQQASTIYKKQEKDGFPLDLQVKKIQDGMMGRKRGDSDQHETW